MKLLDGKLIKEQRIKELKSVISTLERKPGICVIQVGNDPASNVYVSNKEKTAIKLGCVFTHIKFDEDVCENDILSKIDELNNNKEVDGIIVQMPIPKKFNTNLILNRVSSNKDIDGLTDISIGKLIHNKDTFIPCTPNGILEMLKYYNISVEGKNVVIVGRSDLVGKPLAALMTNNNATVTICHSYTTNLNSYTKKADILIVAVGKPNLINKEMVKTNSIIVDVGINRVNDTLVGDVDYLSVKDKVKYITPVPGGVGQMTVLSLYENLLKAYELNNK